MDEIFGVSMNLIMVVLVVLLAISLGSIIFVALSNRIMFKMGLRNIPRRRAQTTLIVLGLMLSTVIISAAFTTGDTVNRSVTSEVYRVLGSMDETVIAGTNAGGLDDNGGAVVNETSYPQSQVAGLADQLRSDPRVDAVIPAYSNVTVAVNLTQKLSSPVFNLMGLDPQGAANLSDIKLVNGGVVHVTDLAPDELYVTQSGADDLDLKAGDSVTLFTAKTSQVFKVKGVVDDKRLAGSSGVSTDRSGAVVPLGVAQSFFGEPGNITHLIVSNAGDSRGALKDAPAVESEIDTWLSAHTTDTPLTQQKIKSDGVDVANAAASIFTTFFLVLGLFSIGAGVLLIFMIFVMLAAERKSEMGMARAVGTRRFDLVQTFLSEGMAYNVLSAMVGTAIGVVVAFVISKVMASIFSSANLDITPHVTARSLIISYSLGVVLTFLTVTFSSWRISLINIVRAIRDIPEPPAQKPHWGARGFFPTLRDLFFQPTDRGGWKRRGVALLGFVVAAFGAGFPPLIGLGVLILAGALFSYVWVQKQMPVFMRIAAFIGMLLVLPVTLAVAFFRTFQLGPLLAGAGLIVLGVFVGTNSHSAFLLLFGLSLTPLGLALILRSFGANERLSYTLLAVYLIYIWELDFSVGLVEKVFGKSDGGIEMFFLSGVMVTLAATFLVVYNSDLVLAPISRLGQGLGALLPSIKMAVAYPLANKMRTGMTMAMFCLVIFALTVMSSMNYNFDRLFLSDRALGGWDVSVDENPTSPIGDLQAKLQAANSPAVNDIQAVGVAEIAIRRNSYLCQVTPETPCDPNSNLDDKFTKYNTDGVDQSFITNNNITFQARAAGYNTDRDVWQAMANDPTLAVIDANALAGGGGFGSGGFVSGIASDATNFQPITVRIVDASTRATATVKVIGIVEMGASANYVGLEVQPSVFNSVFAKPDARRFYVQTKSGTNNIEAARQIEASLLTTGAQADSLKKVLQDQTSTFNAFFYLMQGFMGLGLFVGVAAVGVIAFRTVVERRQQIGMLRAIGYTQNMIGMTFLIESAFIAFMGVVSGIVFALILARQLITSQFANQGVTTFAIPWLQVLVIAGLAFGFALIMTLIPSRQAARIPIAQALRYE
ncbi:MAG TPA: FtsX-like permease family protein [Dehalococcoidia bacterium]|nr:FtsX-like permease family protein [Dehalococcoidia bacterium]